MFENSGEKVLSGWVKYLNMAADTFVYLCEASVWLNNLPRVKGQWYTTSLLPESKHLLGKI